MPASRILMPFRRWLPYRATRFAFNFARSADFRSVMLLRWRNPWNLFQPFSDTCLDRYPDVFRFAREELGDSADHSLLSFGCATGEEVLTLRRYFPLAAIEGVDINPRSVARTRKALTRAGSGRMRVDLANSVRPNAGVYDAVFCMAVFRHGGLGASGLNNRCDHLIRFENFERTVEELARSIKPGGLLFVANANFRFSDTAAYAGFDVVWRDRSAPETRSAIFDRHNCFVPGTTYDEVGFRKHR